VNPLRTLVIAVALCAAAIAGCGLGPGKDEGDVTLTVTRDYGNDVLVQKTDSIHESDTVLRVLDRNADITTRYGGGFVQSINGISGTASGGRTSDWFFYVNGIESPVGSTAYDLSGGDRIWWDYRDWTAAMRVPAVVGSWPEPFVHGFQGHHWPAVLDCRAAAPVCQSAGQRLSPLGVKTVSAPIALPNPIVVLVGGWNSIRRDRTAALLADGPDQSGVFARFVGARKPLLEVLNQQGQPAGSIGKGGGLIAALRPGDVPPTWVVTGTDAKGVAAAAALLGPALRNHYAVATQPGAGPIGVPVQ
jgi:hypothetical protein